MPTTPLTSIPLSKEKTKAIERFIAELQNRLRDNVKGIFLFGSTTKETAREDSDIDLLIVYSGIKERKVLEIVSEVGFKIVCEEGEFIEVVAMSEEEYKESLGTSPFLWEVMKFGKPLYSTLEGTEWKLNFKGYLDLAEEYLSYAEDSLKENKFRLSIDTGYNACELLTKALIMNKGEGLASSHGGIVRQFSKLFIVSKELPEHIGRNLHLSLELRAKARYKPKAKIEAEDADFVIKLAKELLEVAKRKLE